MLKCARKARELLLENSNEGAGLSQSDKLLLSRIDIVRFKALQQVADDFVADHSFVREAIKEITQIDCYGSSCEQLTTMLSLFFSHRSAMSQYQSSREGKTVATAAVGVRTSPTSTGEDDEIARRAALREVFHVIRPLSIMVLDRTLKVPMAIRNVTLINLSYLRMRLALLLGDEVLAGVAFSSHSTVLTIGSYNQEAFNYISLAKRIDVKSDFLRVNILAAETTRGLWMDLEVTNANSKEAVALCKHLQMHSLLSEQFITRFMGLFHSASYRKSWAAAQDHWKHAIDSEKWQDIGQAVRLRMCVLNVLNCSHLAVRMVEDVLALESGVMTKLRLDKHFLSMRVLALFRSGREEEANELLPNALARANKQNTRPWAFIALVSLLEVLFEMLGKSKKLRKKGKTKRLLASFAKVVGLMQTHAVSITPSLPHAHYWSAQLYLMQSDVGRAKAAFKMSVVAAEKAGSAAHAAVLSMLCLENLSGQKVSPEAIKRLSSAADLRQLFVAAEKGSVEAGEAYVTILKEGVFSDLVDANDHILDDQSTTITSSYSGSSIEHFLSNVTSESVPSDQELSQTTFTGRKAEITAFEKAVGSFDLENEETCKAREPWIIIGSSGVGKSALLDELAAHCPEKVLLLRGEGRRDEVETGFFAFRNIFANLLGVPRSGSRDDKTKAVSSTIAQSTFFSAIPHKALLKSVLPVDLVDSNATRKMQGANKVEATISCLVRFLTAASFSRKVVIFIDDLQWVDHDSFTLLESLQKVPGIFIVTASQPTNHDDESMYGNFLEQGHVMKLKPLTEAEAERFLADTFEFTSIEAEVVKFCYDRSDGLAFVLKSILQTLLDAGLCAINAERVLVLDPEKVTSPEQLQQLETPQTVRDLIRSRLSKLDGFALSILFVASTIGQYFSVDLLRTAGDYEERNHRFMNELRALIEKGELVIDRSQAHGHLRFSTLSSQQTAYEMQTQETREANHLAVGSALERQYNAWDGGRRRSSARPVTSRQSTSKIGKTSERIQLLPKIALHLLKGGKRLKALEFYFQAGRKLNQEGAGAAMG